MPFVSGVVGPVGSVLLLRRFCCCSIPAKRFPPSSLWFLKTTRLTGRRAASKFSSHLMGEESSETPCIPKKKVTFRLCAVSSYSTEVLELRSEEPSSHIVVVPGNPGAISFYKDFVEDLYELLDGRASISAIGHISHTMKDWECGRMFSLQDQIDHKIDFIKQEIQYTDLPIILVGHSIGAYICLEVLKSLPKQVNFAIGLYPFLTLNRTSLKQSMIGLLARSSILSAAISCFVSLLGMFPHGLSSVFVRRTLGKSWSTTAVKAACSYLLQYHTIRNVLFMAGTEFEKLSEEPDWRFMKEKENDIALLFGIDDHWGPLTLFQEISMKVPGLNISIEREGHMHAYCCTEAGSRWVADHVATLIKSQKQNWKE